MDEVAEPVSRPAWRTAVRLACWALGGLMLGIALLELFLAWATGPAWRSTTGSVISAHVGADQKNGRCLGRRAGRNCPYVMYSPEISYRYQVGGREYRGDGIGDGVGRNYYRRDEALAALGRYTRGPLTVYYDSANPARSALDTGIVSRWLLILGGIGLLLVAAGFMLRETEDGGEDAPPAELATPADEEGEGGYAPQR